MKEKVFTAVGVVIVVAFLGYVARDRYLYITATATRIQTIEAAGVCILAAIAATLLSLSFIISLPNAWRRFRGKSA
jgi:uncharacterized membrane protein YkgB